MPDSHREGSTNTTESSPGSLTGPDGEARQLDGPRTPRSPVSSVPANGQSGEWTRRLTASLTRAARAASERATALANRARTEWRNRRTHPILRSDRAYLDEQDTESHASAQLPPGERIDIPCMWVCEAYLASHASQLVAQIRELGLDRELGLSGSTTETVERARGTFSYRGWRELKALVRHGSGWHSHAAASANLPPGVKRIATTLHFIAPSVCVVCAQFMFDEETARLIEGPFRTKYQTGPVVRDGILTIPSAGHLRDEAVHEVRAMLKRRCTRWLAAHLPGAFTTLDSSHATAELLTTTIADPRLGRSAASAMGPHTLVPADTRPPMARSLGGPETDYITYLRIGSERDTWDGVDLPGVVVRLPDRWDGDIDHLSLATRLQDFSDDEHIEVVGGERTPDSVARHLHYLNGTLFIFALWHLLRVFDDRLSRVRDRLGAVSLSSSRRAVTQLEEIGRDLVSITRDLRPLCGDLVQVSDARTLTRHDAYTFQALDPLQMPFYDASLFDQLASQILGSAKRLNDTERELRSTAESMSGLVAAGANLRVARSNVVLQWVVILLTIVTIALAALALPESVGSAILRALRLG